MRTRLLALSFLGVLSFSQISFAQGVLFVASDAENFAGSVPPDRLGRFKTNGTTIIESSILNVGFPINGMAVSGGVLLAGDPLTNALRRVDFDGNLLSTLTASFPNTCCNEEMVFDGASFYHAHWPDRIDRVDLGTGAVLQTFPQTEPVGMTLVDSTIWISHWSQRQVGTWDPVTNTFTPKFNTPSNAGGLAFDPINRILWVGLQGGSVVPYDLSGNPLAAGFQPFGPISDTIDGLEFVPNVASSFIGITGPQKVAFASEPISTGNGNYYYQRTDFVIPGRGMPLLFQRSYNALDNYSGPLGANWTHTYNTALTATSGGAAIKWGDGHGETFTLSGGSYVPQAGVFSTLVKNPDSTFTLTQKNQTKYFFSATGKLASMSDKNGNTIALSYNLAGNLSQVIDTVGRVLVFSYDGSNRITQITDPSARSVLFSYDANNNLVQSTDPAGGITTFAFDANHRVTSITQPNGQTLLTNTYDTAGRVISQTGGRGFATTLAYGTPNPGDTTITDARGNKTIHTYDSSLRIVKITDPLIGTTSFTYDANNDRTGVTNQNGKTTSFSYDARGNVTGITDALTNTAAFTYDAKNNLLTATNAKAKTTTFTYDLKGNLKTIADALGNMTTLAYDGFGQLTSKTDARSNTTTFSYDAFGNLSRITDALGHITTLNYDGIGRLVSITDPNSHTATAAYDALSRLVKITDPLANQTKFDYDSVGNLLKITDANLNATSYAYDATNNLVSVTDALGHITRYAYDANNNRVTFTNAKGNATSYAYDALNRLNRIADPLAFVTSYAYDPVGNVLAITDAKPQTNRFTYDALNRLLAISYADGKNVAYAYDANGNRTSMADSHGTTAYSYDDLDRLTSVTHPGPKVVTYGYDAIGNRQSVSYPDGKVVRYSYDPVNRVGGVTDWLGRITNYSYDAASNLLGIGYPNSTTASFAYDAANRLTEIRNAVFRGDDNDLNDDDKDPTSIAVFKYLLDRVGNRLQVTDGKGKIKTYAYDSLYQLTSVKTSGDPSDKDNGKVTRFTYDPVGNRLSLTAPRTSINYSYDAADRLLTAGTATFAYDANGNQISKTQTATGQPLINKYDAANRLISVTGGSINSGFAYDGDGNRISQSVGTGTYTYLNDIATALPVVLQESGPDGNISYAYGLGLISETSPAFDFFYHYDGLGSVVALTNPAGKLKAKYVYDAWGETLRSTAKIGTKNKFLFTGEALDPETQLYYLRARYYDPTMGRFTSRDPFSGFAAVPPNALNQFIYSENSPQTYADPLGLLAWSTVLSKAKDIGIATVSTVTIIATGTVKDGVHIVNALSGGRLQALDDATVNLQKAAAVTLIGAVDELRGKQPSLDNAIARASNLVKGSDDILTAVGIIGLTGAITSIKEATNTIQVDNAIKAIFGVHDPRLGRFAAAWTQLTKSAGIAETLYSLYTSIFQTSSSPKANNASP